MQIYFLVREKDSGRSESWRSTKRSIFLHSAYDTISVGIYTDLSAFCRFCSFLQIWRHVVKILADCLEVQTSVIYLHFIRWFMWLNVDRRTWLKLRWNESERNNKNEKIHRRNNSCSTYQCLMKFVFTAFVSYKLTNQPKLCSNRTNKLLSSY